MVAATVAVGDPVDLGRRSEAQRRLRNSGSDGEHQPGLPLAVAERALRDGDLHERKRRDLHGRILADNLAALASQTDARGRSFEVIPIPEAYDVEATSEVFARSYINFALTNGGVVMPTYGTPSGEEAKAAVARAFPDRRIVTVDVGAVVPAGGAIHCITQEQPL